MRFYFLIMSGNLVYNSKILTVLKIFALFIVDFKSVSVTSFTDLLCLYKTITLLIITLLGHFGDLC